VPNIQPFGARLSSHKSLLNNTVLHMRPPRKEAASSRKFCSQLPG